MSLEYPSQSRQAIRDTLAGFGPEWPWASLQDFSMNPATSLQSLGVWWARGGSGVGNLLPSQALLLGGPSVERAARPPEAS